jgi:hypothetical protein
VRAVGQRKAGRGEEPLAGKARRETWNAADSRPFKWLVRAGFVAALALALAKTGRMGDDQRCLFLTLGRVGLTARALVFALIGYFLIRTAFDYSEKSAVGVDGALARLHHQPLGPWVVALVVVGLLTFAVFSFFEARFRRL